MFGIHSCMSAVCHHHTIVQTTISNNSKGSAVLRNESMSGNSCKGSLALMAITHDKHSFETLTDSISIPELFWLQTIAKQKLPDIRSWVSKIWFPTNGTKQIFKEIEMEQKIAETPKNSKQCRKVIFFWSNFFGPEKYYLISFAHCPKFLLEIETPLFLHNP